MRIVSYYARPADFTKGGVNTSRREWMRNISARGHSVVMVDAVGGYASDPGENENLRQESIRHLGRSRGTMVPLALPRLLRKADLLYLHEGWTLSNVVAALLAKILRVPYVVMPHGVYESGIVRTLRPFPLRHAVERWVLRNSLAVHVFLPGEVEEIRSVAPGAAVIEATTGFERPSRTWSPTEPPYLVWVGRLDVHHKGIDLLLSAMSRIDESTRPSLRMVGPDYFEGTKEVKRLISEMGLEGTVELVGPKYGDELESYVSSSRGFVHTPRWECLGRTIVDAMLLGVPTLIATSAQLGAVAQAEGLALTPDLDVDSIAASLSVLAQNPDAAGPAATREWAARYFAWDRSVVTWERLIEAGLARRA